MRNRLLTSLALLLSVIMVMAQAPQGLNYQAVARTSTGAVLANQPIGLEFSIISGTPTGTTVYKETDTATTNEFGLFTAVIGSGTPVTGTLAGVSWGTAGPFYMQVALDPTGGTTYANYGNPTELQSVPYALNAASSSQWYSNGTGIYNANTNGGVNIFGSGAYNLNVSSAATNNYAEFYSDTNSERGYIGTYTDPKGFDVGTGGANTTGTFNLVTQATSRVTVTPAGLVGIGTVAPTQLLTVAGNAMFANPQGSTDVWVSYGSDSALIRGESGFFILDALSSETVGIAMDISNKYIEPEYTNTTTLGGPSELWKAVYATNGTIQTSDARQKKNIADLNMGLKEVLALRPVTYEWINPAEGDNGKIGFIAQEVEKVVPQAVVHDHISDQEIASLKARNKPVPEIRDPYAMNYSEMIPVLTKAIQEQQALIIQLQKEVEQLKSAK